MARETMPTVNTAVSVADPTIIASRFLGGADFVREAVLEERSTDGSVGKKMRKSITLDNC